MKRKGHKRLNEPSDDLSVVSYDTDSERTNSSSSSSGLKYQRAGFLVNFGVFKNIIPLIFYSLILSSAVVLIYSLLLLRLEINLFKKTISPKLGKAIQWLTLFSIIFIPYICVLYIRIDAVVGFSVLICSVTFFLKMYSYSEVNQWFREDSTIDGSVRYPENLYLRDLLYFIGVPTLCYELNFPRNEKINYCFILKEIFLLIIIFSTVQQTIIPLLSMSYLKEESKSFIIISIIENIMSIAVQNILIWSMGFYAFFHSYLNIIAEIFRFADRQFYLDWWNSYTVPMFWRRWNIPVYRWCKRSQFLFGDNKLCCYSNIIYQYVNNNWVLLTVVDLRISKYLPNPIFPLKHIFTPLIEKGYNKLVGSILVFLLSALLHEYAVSCPLAVTKFWAFLMMLIQVPLNFIVQKIPSKRNRNVFLWVLLIIGQPFVVIMYYKEYLKLKGFT